MWRQCSPVYDIEVTGILGYKSLTVPLGGHSAERERERERDRERRVPLEVTILSIVSLG